MSQTRVDLNLLFAFQQVYKDRSISRAAAELGVSQPVLSRSMQRLRRQLKDDLFVRVGNRMEPTQYAIELAGPICKSLDMICASLSQRSDFDPCTDTRKFTLATTEVGEIYFSPKLLAALQEAAPGVTLDIIRNSPQDIADDLESGRCQLAVGYLPGLRETFFQRLLVTMDYVSLFRRDHPVMQMELDPHEYAKLPQVIVTSAAGHNQMEEIFRQAGLSLSIGTQVSDFFAVGPILRSTNLVATVPQCLAEYFADDQSLSFAKTPVQLPPISVRLFWHSRTKQDPGCRWLRSFIAQRFCEIDD
ncbi:MAG: LysR family transcriptional regulator [Achromobacter sp.]|uniref:LysR family transcriptional regulator n=1 Tax=Achromobacter sp. TaxID=134375 RepID=UPI0029BB66A9|nr:LysR family transcriptional regulator [Achromobacter sp.]MDX3985727.1 LysR family transcriptional regulator [Achromobacter sp.]